MAKIITVTVPGDPVDVITLQPDMSPVSVVKIMIPGQQGPGGPQGITGAPGPSSVLSIGTVTTGAAGSAASATLTGVSPSQTLNLTIPRGATGNTGPSPTLSMGTINTLAEGQAATASITGTQLAPILNLGIPRGYGVRAGGTTGQALVKLSGTDHDTGWSTLTAASLTDSTATGRSLILAADAAAARAAISAVSTSDSRLTDARTPVAHTHPATGISDSTATGRSLITAADAPAARAAIGAGTSSLVIGLTATDAAAGNHTHADLTNATSSNTASTLVRRASDGAISVGLVVSTGTPTAANHLTRKDYVDAAVAGTSASTALTLVRRDTNKGFGAGFVDIDNQPTQPYHATRKDYVDTGLSKYKRIIPATEGLVLTGYGHSYLDGRWNGIGPGQKYIDRVNHRLGTILDNNGIGGYHMQDSVLDAIGRRDLNYNFPLGEKGIGIIDCIHNDATKWQLDPVGMLNWEHSLRSLIGWMSHDVNWLLDDTWGFTYAGAWTEIVHGDFWNGKLRMLPNGQTGTVSWVHSIPGRWGFAFAGTSNGGRDMEIVRNNVVVASFNTKTGANCGHTAGGGGARAHNISTWFIDIREVSLNMVIRPKAGGSSTDNAYLDIVYRLNTVDPAKIFLPEGLPAYNLSDAGWAQYNARLQAVANEFPNAYFVPTLAGYNKATMIGADGVHLSRLGTEYMADVLTEYIRDVFE